MPPGISDADQLLRAIEEALKFPAYFGANWNALFDCLRDFHWLDEAIVVLQHDDIPALPPHDLRTYIEVLQGAVADWGKVEQHRLVVVFPASSRSEVRQLLHGL